LFVTSLGNDFMIEIARLFVEGLRAGGIGAELCIDTLPLPGVNTTQIIVAPHEFYPLFLERQCTAGQIRAITKAAYLLNTEQPGSYWFDLAYQSARQARGVLDMNRQGVEEFRRRGVAARYAQLGYAPSLEADSAEPTQEKPIDILFLASHSLRREMFLSRHASFFNQYRCRLIITRLERPRHAHTPGFFAGQQRNHMLRNSKLLINIHASERTYFEWHRALLAMANHCLIVSERSDHIEPLISGRDLVVADLEDLASACQYYLEHETERHAIAQRAYLKASTELHAATLCHTWYDSLPQSRGSVAAP
jgi:hypothetical protein